MRKRLFLLFLLLVNFYLFSDDKDLARYYIVKANESLRNGDINLSKNLLDTSFGYYKFYPEYYYLMNQIIEPKRETFFKKNQNAQKILQYIDNQFLINKYIMLKEAFIIFRNTLDYKNLFSTFSKISGLQAIDTLEDYLIFIQALFIFQDYTNLEKILAEAKARYESLDIEYYYLLFVANKKNLGQNEFKKRVDILQANNYSLTKLLYLKTIFYNDSNNIKNLFLEYKNLRSNLTIETEYKKDIVFNLLIKSSFLNKVEQIELLNHWLSDNGLNDFRSDLILKDNRLFNLIKNQKNIYDNFIFFDGIRIKDIDKDGNWEELYEYKKGSLIREIVDSNQDGLYEFQIDYFNNKIKSYYQYFNENNDNYKKYNFNINDSSISSIEYYNKSLIKRINLIKSTLIPDLKNFKGIKDNEILNYVDNIEYFENEYIVERYKNGTIVLRLIDKNNNSFFEIREEYKNGIKEKSYNDLNENGFPELIKIYKNGNLNTVLYSNDEKSNFYDYKEVIEDEKPIRYWDTNFDNIYEVCVEEKGKTVLTKFDINFDGIYDIIYEQKENVINIYRNYKGEYKLINSYKKEIKTKEKGWLIISVRNPDLIEIPDEIEIKDSKKLNGFFYYKNKKYYFENGNIKNEDMAFMIFIFEGKIYLIDQQGAAK